MGTTKKKNIEWAIIKSFNGNNVAIPNQIIGYFHDRNHAYHHYITIEHLMSFFKQWHLGEETLKKFLMKKHCSNMPIPSCVMFKYDPLTGQKIDWKLIADCFLNK